MLAEALQLPPEQRAALAGELIQSLLCSLGRNVSETVLTKLHHELVMTGPYRWVRHPLYTTGLTLFFAIGLMQASWFVLLFGLIAALLIRFVVIPAEEREFLAMFGNRYQVYMGRTGRLLPRGSSPDHFVGAV